MNQRKFPWGWIALIAIVAIVFTQTSIPTEIGKFIQTLAADIAGNQIEQATGINPRRSLIKSIPTLSPGVNEAQNREHQIIQLEKVVSGRMDRQAYLVVVKQDLQHNYKTQEGPSEALTFLKIIDKNHIYDIRVSAGIDFASVGNVKVTEINEPGHEGELEINLNLDYPTIYSVEVMNQETVENTAEIIRFLLGSGISKNADEIFNEIRPLAASMACEQGILNMARTEVANQVNRFYADLKESYNVTRIIVHIPETGPCAFYSN